MISFIIPTQSPPDHLVTTVNSILSQEIPGYEVILVGPTHYEGCKTIAANKITEKFNAGVQAARNDYVCWLRDYMTLDKDWFRSAIWDYDICMSRIINPDGSRFRDWCSWDDPEIRPEPWLQYEPWCSQGLFWPAKAALVPYSYDKTDKMYVSGSYLLGRKEFLLRFPMNEDLNWSQSEDVEWSIRARKHWNYKMNAAQIVHLQKYKDPILPNHENSPPNRHL